MKNAWFRGVAALAAAIINGALLVAAPITAQAQDTAVEQVAGPEAVWTRWFVELKSPPTADGASLATVRGEKAAFRKAATQGRHASRSPI